jgi:acyl-CoA reductase-like NAD-dependent aldehyde dehydrogenase
MKESAPEMARQLTREMGKPYREAHGEVMSCVHALTDEVDEVVEALEPEVSTDGRTQTTLYRDPLGVCAAITPWNYPCMMPSSLLVPALVAGNCVILKPSEETPLSGQAYADCLRQVLPVDVLQVIHGADEQGKALVRADVDLIAFTGSREAGVHILGEAAARLKRVVLELGGKDALVVLSDADVEAAAKFAAKNSFSNAGQVCVSSERIYVDQTIAPAFEAALIRHAATIKVGNGLEEGVRMGPMINARQRSHVIAQVQSAIEAGARLVWGKLPEGDDTCFLEPMVLTGVTPDMDISVRETFGPVACVAIHTDDRQAVQLANAGEYGLGAVVFGTDEARAYAVARQLDAGMIGVNRWVGGARGTPWVGAKQSGYGFHSGVEGHRQFAQVRIVSRST